MQSMQKMVKTVMKRISLTIPKQTNDTVQELADEWNVSKAQAVKILIERGLNIEYLTACGGEIVYRLPDGTSKVIYRPAISVIDAPDLRLGEGSPTFKALISPSEGELASDANILTKTLSEDGIKAS